MRYVLTLLALLLPTPALAGLDAPPPSAAQLAAIQATIPTAGSGSPTAVVDTMAGSAGTAGVYAPFMHTHPSKARKGRVLVPASGTAAVTFTAAMGDAPLCSVTAETTAGDTNVVNAQIDGVTTVNGFTVRITRTAISVASLLGLNILSVPTQVATYAHYICVEP